jgi:Mce-associated membrane protein
MSTTAKQDARTPRTERVSDAKKRAEAARAALELVEAEVAAMEAEAAAAQARTRLSELQKSVSGPDETRSAATTVDATDAEEPENEPNSDTTVSQPGIEPETSEPRPGRLARLHIRAGGLGKLRTWWRPWGLSVIALTVAAVALGVVGVDQRLDHRSMIATRDRDVQIVDTAREGVRAMLSVNQNSVDADVKKILDGATGEWKADFSQRSTAFATVVRDANVTTAGKIDRAGIEKRNADGSYSVLVAASSQVTNAAGAQDEPRKWRLRVLVKPTPQGDKIAKMEFVP